jgi:hypothetical protein
MLRTDEDIMIDLNLNLNGKEKTTLKVVVLTYTA